MNYNQIVPQQRELSQTIEESLNVIVAALETKLQLAAQQKHLQAGMYPDLSPADVRAKVLDQVVRRLEGRDITPLRDWTTRFATTGGNLDE